MTWTDPTGFPGELDNLDQTPRPDHHWHYDQAVAALDEDQQGGAKPVTACAHMLGALYRLLQERSG
jgi:hypothetical protein